MMMKRSRGDMESISNMAKCLILLSRGGGGGGAGGGDRTESMTHTRTRTPSPSRVFECKTCNRQFPSFQALGGHRASHKKPRLTDSLDHQNNNQVQVSQMKPKIHECSICGLEFAIGQALGGHMRRHRAALSEAAATAAGGLSSSSCLSDVTPPTIKQQHQEKQVPVLKRSNSRRVLCLDLNLSPPDISADFEFISTAAGKITSPVIHCFI